MLTHLLGRDRLPLLNTAELSRSLCAFAQLRTDCSGTPISRATLLTGSPPRTRRNDSSLNSRVYATLGTLFIQHLQQHNYLSLSLVPDNRWEAHAHVFVSDGETVDPRQR